MAVSGPTPKPPRRLPFLLGSRLGQLFLILAALWVLQSLGVLVFDSIAGLVSLGFWIFVIGFSIRGLVALRGKLLWRIRRKLIISYILIGLVPTVLVLSFFLLSAYLIFAQLSSYIVMASLDRTAVEAAHVADLALADVLRGESQRKGPLPPAEIARLLRLRSGPLLAASPEASVTFLTERGRIAAAGPSLFKSAAADVPSWARTQSYRGLLRIDDVYVMGALSEPLSDADAHVVVAMPLNAAFAAVERETGLKVEHRSSALVRASERGISVTVPDGEDGGARRPRFSTAAQPATWTWVAFLQARRWDSGEIEEDHQAAYVRFSWLAVYNLIGTSTSQVQLGRALLMVLGILAALFLAATLFSHTVALRLLLLLAGTGLVLAAAALLAYLKSAPAREVRRGEQAERDTEEQERTHEGSSPGAVMGADARCIRRADRGPDVGESG